MNKLYTLLSLLTTVLSFAQIKFETGQFTANDGTTTQCLIRNLDWDNNPYGFEYKISTDDETRKASITNVKAFSVSGITFERHTVQIDRSSSQVGSMSQQRNPIFETETIFLRLVFDGKTKLFRFQDINLSRFFIASDDAVPEQLVFKEYKVDDSRIGQNNLFRQQLFTRLQSEGINEKDVEKLAYNKKELVAVFRKAFQFDEKNSATTDAATKTKVNFRLFAGVAFGKIKSENTFDDFFDKVDESKVAPIAGCEVEIVLPVNRNKWALIAAPLFSSVKVSKTGNVKTDIDYTFVSIPIGVRHYFFLTDRTKLFLNAGASINLALSSSLKIKSQYAFAETDFPMQSIAFGTFGGFGISVDRISLEARCDFSRRLLKNADFWEAKYSSVSLIAAYRFN
ncbi:outer membrane beta-barrel protein [Flavobacterium sp.]|uniref:outer membrane beta-barrel protein n=1 Tax=Flavobacterium sp. TaxID=239 RepID=UPI0011FB14D9|nr:outer membrane beta-barrel protein [Flavobacterium sp.]RZJ72980.1 MAG: hypothetical protein EOO49_04955 [Flavobacterium sp.]